MTPAPEPQIRRPVYREGRLLEVAELRAEQQSRTGALTRHERNVHTPGVAIGLEVMAGAGGVQIQPGLAVDGAGRYLVLERPLTASLAGGENVTASIIWRGGTSQIELSDVPPPVPADRTGGAWPVVLGRASRARDGTVTVDTDAREEVELRAAALTAPAGGSRVVLGGQSGRSSQILGVQLADGHGGFVNVTTIDSDGRGHVSVATSVTGEVKAAGRVALGTPVPAPSAASPWSLYRAAVTRPDKTMAEQLRLEIGEVKSGVDPRALELLVAQGGTSPAKNLLHVDGGGTVTIPGGLVVEGFTAVSGGAGPAATTLSGLAAQEADVPAMARALLNQLTDTDLKAAYQNPPTVADGVVSYTLQLTSSASTAVTRIAAYEIVIGTVTATHLTSVLSRQFVAQGVNLSPGSSYRINRTIRAGPGRNVSVAVLAARAGPDGQPRSATFGFLAIT